MLRFACSGARPEPYAAGPSLVLDVRITAEAPVHAIVLRTQIRIEPRGRTYAAEEMPRLADLFGEPSRWAETLDPLQLATVASAVTAFATETTVPVVVPLTADLDLAATKYFAALEPDADGVPLLLLFSGTVFFSGPAGVQVGLVPWHEEATLRLPVATWRAAMEAHHGGTGYLRLTRRTLEALSAYRSAQAIPTWDDTVERLLKEAGDA